MWEIQITTVNSGCSAKVVIFSKKIQHILYYVILYYTVYIIIKLTDTSFVKCPSLIIIFLRYPNLVFILNG